MKIKRVEIQGFKSLPDRTVFKFQESGLTAVVGPNGCGKSNIVDAIRWALGEQSVKLLRGSTMEDVIFNGSERRKPLGMAEVILVFDNSGGLAQGPWREYAEITVTRRLFRSGDSEYLINGVACRLKDVRELLMDTGGSSRGYSIVEQGRISLLINSKPEEKRALIEEAAGILKYRVRRTEAERKIEKTRENMLRVADVTREVRRQHDGMQRSVEKARKYRELRGELDRLVLRQRFEDYRDLTGQLALLDADLSSRQVSLADREAGLMAGEAREESLRLALAGGEEKVSRLFEEVRRGEGEMARMEGDISVREHAIASLEERLARLGADLCELDTRKDSEQDGVVQLELELTSIAAEHSRSREELERAAGDAAAAESELAGAGKGVEAARSRLFALGTERSRLVSEIDSEARALEGLARRRAEISTRSADLTRRVDEGKAAGASRAEAAARLRMERDLLAGRMGEERLALDEARARLADLERDLALQAETLAELRGLSRTLSSLEEEREGFSVGVRTVLRDYARQSGGGILGVVADNLEVPARYEKAVLALLGERLQNVIVSEPEQGRSAVSFLKERALGRGSFIPQAPRTNGKGRSLPSGEGVLGPVTELVPFPEKLRGVGEALFGGAVLVEDLDRALSLWRGNGHSATLVTLDGDVVEPTGVVTGGSVEGEGAHLLARKRRLRETASSLGELEKKDAEARAARDRLGAEVERRAAGLAELEADHREKERAALSEESALTVAEGEIAHLSRSLAEISLELTLVEAEAAELAGRAENQRARLDGVEREEGEAKASLQAFQLRYEELSLAVNQTRVRAEQARLSLSTVGLRKENSEKALEGARSRTQEMEGRRERIDLELAESQGKIAAHREAIAAERGAVRTAATALQATQEALVAAREAQDAARAEADQLGAQVRALRAEIGEARAAASALDIRIHELRTERENLASRARDESARELAEMNGTEFAEERFDRGAAPDRVLRLRERITALGDVNPGAVEEFEGLAKRLEFLTAQKDDLDLSMAQLAKAIRQINKTSRELFLATFAEVREKFSQVLPTLYQGSRGEMVLLDENDPLNSGVEIHVSPPGKKLRSMQLLSGGEKALVALAMIFTIFLVKPSPFCILDEVDAPLDEHNVGNVVEAMRKLAAASQFLVITHNKLTMEAADILYGVTMREPGVSQVVSVRLSRATGEEAAA